MIHSVLYLNSQGLRACSKNSWNAWPPQKKAKKKDIQMSRNWFAGKLWLKGWCICVCIWFKNVEKFCNKNLFLEILKHTPTRTHTHPTKLWHLRSGRTFPVQTGTNTQAKSRPQHAEENLLNLNTIVRLPTAGSLLVRTCLSAQPVVDDASLH